ncbi:MAG: hypothetical protein L6R48_09630 [Planctomycetes bacterium]|nr:hypothetical protein [Planctomycetota bacterium]
MPRRAVVAALLALAAPLAALDAANGRMNKPFDDVAQDDSSFSDIREEAAHYRLGRANAPAAKRDEAVAGAYLAKARRRLADGHEIRARWAAEDGFEEAPYSERAGDLLRTALEAAAVGHDVAEVREKLLMLWLYLPDYPGMEEAMRRALEVAERDQDFQAVVNLDADQPSEVVAVDGRSVFTDTASTRIFRFLSRHGDRTSIAPRAALGLARSKLISGAGGDRDAIFEARAEYERFLTEYPDSAFTFPALCEYALSYLVTYRGAHYDLGTLVMAQAIIDQAEVEARGDQANVRTVLAYRKRVRGWLQDRDLSVARWYAERGSRPGLRWLFMPAGLQSWQDGSRFFYREVMRRDPGSRQGLDAERELALVPASGRDVLGQ